MPASISKQIVQALRTRAAGITKANGYNTDAGKVVIVNRETFDEETEIPSVMILPGLVSQSDRRGDDEVLWSRPFVIEAIATEDTDNPGDVAEDLMADLQQAILDPADVTLGGLAVDVTLGDMATALTEDGSNIAGAFIDFTVVFSTGYGNPY